MEESKNILYYCSLNEYLEKKKRKIVIDEKISKEYQFEILYKKLKGIILYNINNQNELIIKHNTVDEYRITKKDVKDCIKKCFELKDSEVEFINKTELCLYNDFLWFEKIDLNYFNGSSIYTPSTTIKFKIDIPSMIKILRYRNSIINIQKRFLYRMYIPPDGLFVRKGYEEINNIINSITDNN